MSRATVREAVATYLAPTPHLFGVAAVLRAQPKNMVDAGVQFTDGSPGAASGAVVVVGVPDMHEQAVALDGMGGGRLSTYQVEVGVFHRSVEEDALVAQDHLDQVLDAIADHLRRDPALGTATGIGPVTSGSVLSGAYDSLHIACGQPELGTEDGGWIDTWAVVSFTVQEWNQPT